MVRATTCCEGCPLQALQDVSRAVAFNKNYAPVVTAQLCGQNPLPCPEAACVVAPSYVLPFCIEGRCQAIDIRQDLLTSCGTDEQCRLRWDTGCYEAGGTAIELLVAVSSQVNYDRTVCGNQMPCPSCVVDAYPANAKAVCGPDFHCSVAWLR
jgi:hypothetical protein